MKLRVFVNGLCLNGVFDSFVGCILLGLRNVTRHRKFPKESHH